MKKNLELVLIIVIGSFLLLLLFLVFRNTGEQQFVYLARYLMVGRLDMNQYPHGWSDMALFNGNYYWPLGPFSAVILTPFVFIFDKFGLFFYQKYLQLPIIVLIFYLCYKIARYYKFTIYDSYYLCLAFVGASVFFPIAVNSWSWPFAQIVTVGLIFSALYLYLAKKNYILLGSIYAALLLTRATASLGILFFVLEILTSRYQIAVKIRKLFLLLIPFLLGISVFCLYNYLRFGSFFEQGYSHQVIGGAVLKARNYGLFSLVHIPGNLYYFLISAPLPVFKDGISHVLKFPFLKYDVWGAGIFFTSPYFIYLFFLTYKDRISRFLWLTTLTIAIVIFMYYGIGVYQFGYRYSLDFLPYLFLLLIKNYREQKGDLSLGFKMLIVASVLLNMYLYLTFS